MPSLVVLFNLRDGIDADTYEAWARETDVPGVSALGSVDRFDVLRARGLLMSDDAPPYQYVEVIEVNDLDAFGQDMQSETVKKTAAEFQQFADAPVFILMDAI